MNWQTISSSISFLDYIADIAKIGQASWTILEISTIATSILNIFCLSQHCKMLWIHICCDCHFHAYSFFRLKEWQINVGQIHV